MNDIAILNLTRFGDLIQTTPVLKSLRKRHPGARIHVIVKKRFRSVAEILPAVDMIHEVNGDVLTEAVSKAGIAFIDRFRRVRDIVDPLTDVHFDLIYNFTHSRASAVLLSLLDADRATGFTLDRNGQRRVDNHWLGHMATLVHARRLSRFNLVDLYLGAAGVAGSREPVSVHVPQAAREFATDRLRGSEPLLGVQLGASTDTKTWSIARFAETLHHLARRIPSMRVVLVGVAAEEPAARELMAACPEVSFEDLVGKTRVDELAGVLEKLDLLLTCDTGTMHLAGAVGTQTCAIFVGLGTPYETAVYAEGHWALMSRIDCAPCAYNVKCGHTVCHTDIPPAWLADLLQRILESKPLDGLPALPRADLLRTRFSEDGLLEMVPLHPRLPQSQDLMALAYRAAFLEGLESIAARPERIWSQAMQRFGIEPHEWSRILSATLPAQLEQLATLAERGEQITSRLEKLADQPSALREGASSLHETDQAIYATVRSEPLLAPLGLAHEATLEDLPEADLPTLASLSNQAYRSLHRRVSILRELSSADPSMTLTLHGGQS